MKWMLSGINLRRKILRGNQSYGIIVFRRFPRSTKYLIIKHSKGHWSFPKGHPNKNEKKIRTALRELREETGIKKPELIVKKILIDEHYYFVDKYGIKNLKKVGYFIGETVTKKVTIDYKEIVNFKWSTFNKALKQITFQESRNSLKKANKIVNTYLK